jgi:hypothetical protein
MLEGGLLERGVADNPAACRTRRQFDRLPGYHSCNGRTCGPSASHHHKLYPPAVAHLFAIDL